MNQTVFSMAELQYLLPEIILFVGGCVVLLLDAFGKDAKKFSSYLLSQSILVAALIAAIITCYSDSVILQNHYQSDALGWTTKIAILAISIPVLSYVKDFMLGHEIYKSEFYVLGIYSVLGMLVMSNAASLLVLYLGLEMLALSTYVLVAFDRNSGNGSEAAMKYFVLGAVASGLILYGMSMAYGATGTLQLTDIAAKTSEVVTNGQLASNLPLMLAMVFLLAGILFKLGAVPFHMWVPDVYQGAPASSVAMMSAAPKIAAFVMLLRVLIEGFSSAIQDWQPILILVATLSIIFGNLIAIMQTEIKRMLGYSTISHVGFMLLGLSALEHNGAGTGYFYVITYAISAAAVMAVVIIVSKSEDEQGGVEIANLRGLNKQSPGLALVLLLGMMSMAGVPVLMGFFAKLAVIQSIISAGYLWLAVIAVVFSVIGAFYYLRVVKAAYFDEIDQPLHFLKLGLDSKIFLTVNAALILLIGLMPQTLLELCQKLFQ